MTKLQELKKKADDAWVAYFANPATDTDVAWSAQAAYEAALKEVKND